MGQWTPRPTAEVASTDRTKVGTWFHELELRPGERFIRRVKPSQLTNFWFFLTLAWAIANLLANLAFGPANVILFLVSMGLYFKRMMPFWYITNERVVQVDIKPSGAFEEFSVDLNRITSVVKRDPIFGSLLHLQGLDVFVAEGSKPKLSIRFLRDADSIHTLLSPSRR